MKPDSFESELMIRKSKNPFMSTYISRGLATPAAIHATAFNRVAPKQRRKRSPAEKTADDSRTFSFRDRLLPSLAIRLSYLHNSISQVYLQHIITQG